MSIITYEAAPAAGPAPQVKGFWSRMFDRMVEARTRQTNEIISRHRHLLPRELEEAAGWRITERSEDSLPFIR